MKGAAHKGQQRVYEGASGASPVRKHRAYLRISDRRHGGGRAEREVDYMAACEARRAGLLARFLYAFGYRIGGDAWRENIYTAEEPRSMADMLTKAPTRFSAVDCPVCGCQIALAIRVPRVDLSDNAERNDADALNIPASPYPDGDKGVLACPNCGSGEYLHNADENENAFCGQCGQAIKWGCEDEN